MNDGRLDGNVDDEDGGTSNLSHLDFPRAETCRSEMSWFSFAWDVSIGKAWFVLVLNVDF